MRTGYFDGQRLTYLESNGSRYFQGDILLPEPDAVIGNAGSEAVAPLEKSAAVALKLNSSRWPNNVVFYAIDPALTDTKRVTDAIWAVQVATKVRFYPRTTEKGYLYFTMGTDSKVCSSYMGYRGGKQDIVLPTGCGNGETIHEILHALGFHHEQNRIGRGEFIKVIPDNIEEKYRDQFAEVSRADYENIGAIDFASIMMYGSTYFAIDPKFPSMTRLDGTTWPGQRVGLSSLDISGLIRAYPDFNVLPDPGNTIMDLDHDGKGLVYACLWVVDSPLLAVWNGGSWSYTKQKALKVSLDGEGRPWTAYQDKYLWQWTGTGWKSWSTPSITRIDDLAVASNTRVYVVANVRDANGNRQVFSCTAGTSLTCKTMPLNALLLAADGSGNLYAMQNSGDVYKLTDAAATKIGSGFSRIGCGRNGTLYGVSNEQMSPEGGLLKMYTTGGRWLSMGLWGKAIEGGDFDRPIYSTATRAIRARM